MKKPKYNKIRFDDALPTFARLVIKHLGEKAFHRNAILRDASGRLTLIAREEMTPAQRRSLSKIAFRELQDYVESVEWAVASPNELFDETLCDSSNDLLESMIINEKQEYVRLIERKIIGQDWLRPNFRPIEGAPPIITFYSCKGGVGRSTALAITAASLALLERNILVIDLDLEAPGLDSMLLSQEQLPEYGILDALVENGISGADEQFLKSCVAPSPLTMGRGLVEVVPVVGAKGRSNPGNIIPKLARALLEDNTVHQEQQTLTTSFPDQVRDLIKSLSDFRRYDAVFVDARSGLSENAAAAVIGLGGDVLLFGVDTPQTFDAYSYLLAHLKHFAHDVEGEFDWRRRLRMVHAKAKRGRPAEQRFRERCQDLFSKFLYEEADIEDTDAFNFDFDDETAPHYAWTIPYDVEYAEFDPVSKPTQLQQDFFDRSFGPITKQISALITVDADAEQ